VVPKNFEQITLVSQFVKETTMHTTARTSHKAAPVKDFELVSNISQITRLRKPKKSGEAILPARLAGSQSFATLPAASVTRYKCAVLRKITHLERVI
jgi:hypothetical protein